MKSGLLLLGVDVDSGCYTGCDAPPHFTGVILGILPSVLIKLLFGFVNHTLHVPEDVILLIGQRDFIF